MMSLGFPLLRRIIWWWSPNITLITSLLIKLKWSKPWMISMSWSFIPWYLWINGKIQPWTNIWVSFPIMSLAWVFFKWLCAYFYHFSSAKNTSKNCSGWEEGEFGQEEGWAHMTRQSSKSPKRISYKDRQTPTWGWGISWALNPKGPEIPVAWGWVVSYP